MKARNRKTGEGEGNQLGERAAERKAGGWVADGVREAGGNLRVKQA